MALGEKKEPKKARVRLRCPKCRHVWDYTGKAKAGQRVTCPSDSCRTSVNLDERAVLEIYDEGFRRSFEEYLRQREEAEAKQGEKASEGVDYQGI